MAPRKALVSGTSSGIGAAVAERLLAEGWHVTGLSRRDPGRSESTYTHLGLDLTDPAAVRQALAGLEVDALVHAAGLLRTAPLGTLQADAGEAMWRLHVEAASLLADCLVARMPAGGRVVLIGSRTASGAAGRSQYAASKAALVGLSRSWAAELVGRGITVNIVAPAATDTPMLRDPARGGVPPRLPPLGRFVRPEEVAGTVAFLLGPDAAAITGQQIVICGGSSL